MLDARRLRPNTRSSAGHREGAGGRQELAVRRNAIASAIWAQRVAGLAKLAYSKLSRTLSIARSS